MNKVLLSLALAATLAGCSTGNSSCKKSSKPLRVLSIGNSFSISTLTQLPACAKAAGCELDLCTMYIGGCTLEQHWNNVIASTNSVFLPYGMSRDSKGVRAGGRANIPQVLSADRWDIVVLQQASHLSWQPNSYEPYGGNLIDLIRRLAPQAEIVIQETWSYTPYDHRLKSWGLTPETMYEKIKSSYAGFAARYGLRIIPTGAAVQDFRHAMPSPDGITGDPCGNPKGPDKFHLNREGEYLQACTWFAALYHRPAADIPYRPDFMTAERAEQMRKSADTAINALRR